MTQPTAKKKILIRSAEQIPPDLSSLHPILQRLFSARGIESLAQLDRNLARLPSPWLLAGMSEMVDFLITAIKQQQKMVVVADYDADGATSCAVAIKGLSLLGAKSPAFVVPNRFEYGYGLTPEIVQLVKKLHPDVQVIITVDNGISSFAGVKTAKEFGICVLVTDHHLPAAQLPEADAIVNPNLRGCQFPSHHLAGCGVVFYVLMALRSRMRELGHFNQHKEPVLSQLLDYVALGTVADVVTLDQVNRILVHQGLLRIRSGQCHAGLLALITIAGKVFRNLTPSDMGFSVAPRLNAAGRMDDMSLGIQCLLTDDSHTAQQIAQQLDALNKERKEVEAQMQHQALILLEEMQGSSVSRSWEALSGVCLFNENWHQGVIGILASRIKDRLHRPVIAFAPAGHNEIKGSARSIVGVHIRDVLSDIAIAHPQILSKFGGHAMAAGLSLQLHDLPAFTLAFDEMVGKRLQGLDLEKTILSDGELTEAELTLEFAQLLQNCATWGQGFPEPLFNGVFDVVQCRIVGSHHLKLVLRLPFTNSLIDAIAFFVEQPESWAGVQQIQAVYKLDINEYRGQSSVQLQIQYLERKH
jgi:single-stranded-DNA-specific exonuclease